MRIASTLFAVFAALLHASPALPGGEIEQDVVFRAGEDGYHTYRIPSLLPTKNGTLLALCEGRKSGGGDAGDIDVVLKRSNDGGKTWGELQVIWNDGTNTCGNPCPVVDRRTGRIVLLLTHNLGDDNEPEIKSRTGKSTRTVWVCHSDDEGATWSAPREITNEAKDPDWTWYATGPGVGVQLAHGPHAGRLVIPCDHAYLTTNEGQSTSEFGAHAIVSDDGGTSWQRSEAIAPQMNECQVAELAEPFGGLLLDMRSYRGKACRAQSVSHDGGMTWTEPRNVPALVEPVCQASLIRCFWPRDSRPGLLAFSNPADPKKRVKMTVRTSRDDGRTWSDGTLLHAGPSAYSCLATLPDGTVACLYERGEKSAYETITIARMPADRVTGAPQP